MKITGIRAYATSYTPLHGAFELSGGRRFSDFPSLLVRVDTDAGVSGWGEHASSPQYMVALHEGAIGAVRLMAPALIGADPREIGVIHDRMNRALQGHAYAKTALDIACWDIAGKAADVPVATLLGGIYQRDFPLIDVVHLNTPEDMREQADRLLEKGVEVIQIKVGGAWKEDVARIRTTWESAQAFRTVIVDANAHWLQHEAQHVADATRDLDIMIEQPCRELEQNLAVRRRSIQPFVLDESLDGLPSLYRAQAADVFDCAMLKFSRFGGIAPLRLARDNCVSWGKAVTVEDMAGGAIIAAASAHIAASTPPQHLVTGSFVTTFLGGGSASGVRQEGGRGWLPEGPGLGVEVDEKALGAPILEVTDA